MNRKKPVLKNIFLEWTDDQEEFHKILKLGLLLALREQGILNQHQFDLAEKQLQ